jgi:site-specific DNA recombinase
VGRDTIPVIEQCMKTFYGYIRVSTVKQGVQGVSLQEQRAAIEGYAARHGFTIVSWFEETQTAAKRGRPLFTRMLKLLKNGKAAGVIIHKIDRSARNLKDWADLGQLIDSGVDVHFATESLDLHSRGGRLSADLQAVVAADFIRNLRIETRKGFYGRLRQGLYPLPAPLGYVDHGRGKPKTPDPEKAPLIIQAFELYATATYNLETLREELYQRGLRNTRGGKVSLNGVSRILNNPFYAGLIYIKSTNETFPGIHDPLISTVLFERVQGILKGKINTRTQKHLFLFRRLLVCKYCRYSLIGELQKGTTYYRCHTKDCPTTGIREDVIDVHIKRALKPIELTHQEVAELRAKLTDLRANWTEEKEKYAKGLMLQNDRLQDRMDRLTDAYVEQLIEKSVFEERRATLLMEKKAVETKLAELQEQTRSIPDKMEKFLEQAESVYVNYQMRLPEEKRNLLQNVTSNRFVQGKNVVIELHSPYRELANRSKISHGDPTGNRTPVFAVRGRCPSR